MNFSDEIKQFSERVITIKDNILTEEATKMSLIVPFFQLLGYDVFNPSEFYPEYTADVGIKKGEKVDYAIMQDGNPSILIECKWCGDALDKHGSQLFRYFGTTSAKFGILTNGLLYRFYTDLDEANKMDLTPFLEINLLEIKEGYLLELKKFSKENFDKDSIFSTAAELKYSNLLKELLKKELDDPSENFVRLLISSIYDGQKNQKVIDKFKPIVKKSFNGFINELVNAKISSALTKENADEPITEPIIAGAGHDLGNHSENHKQMSTLSKQQCIDEIMKPAKKIKELTGVDMTLFRPPYGDYNNTLLEATKECGYHCIQWDVDSLDAKRIT